MLQIFEIIVPKIHEARNLTFSSASLINQYLSIWCHALHTDVHLLARGVVEKLHLGFSLVISLDIGLPPDGAAEVRHGRYHAVVLRLERGGLVEALEVGAAKAFVALSGEKAMGVEVYDNVMYATVENVAPP